MSSLPTHSIDESSASARLRDLFPVQRAGTPEGLWQVDIDNRTLYVSQNVASMLGYDSSDALVGKPLDEFIFAADMLEHRHEMENRHRGIHGMYQRRFRRKDGSECWCLVSALPLADGEGKIVGSIAMLADYNEHKHAEETRLRQLASLRALNEISAINYGTLEEKLKAALSIGARLFGIESGIVSQIEGDTYTVLAHVSSSAQLQDGQKFSLEDTYCELTLKHDSVFAIDHAGASANLSHPCFRRFRLESYIGAPVRVGGKVYGTVSFSSLLPFSRPFDQTDHEFMWLLSRWLGSAIERRQSQQRLAESEAKYRSVVDNVKEVIFQTDVQGRWTFLNPAWEEVTGFGVEASLFTSFLDYIHPDERQRNQELFAHLIEHREEYCRHEIRYRHKDGGFRWVELLARVMCDKDGRSLGTSGTLTDITQRKQSEEQLHLAASVFTHAREGIMITAADGTILNVNDAFQRITGYALEDVRGNNPRMLQSGHQDAQFYAGMWNDLKTLGHWQGEVWNRRKTGEPYVELLTISAIRDETGKTINYVALFSDITTQKEHQKQLEHIAHYDALTGLPNRLLLGDRLRQAMSRAMRNGKQVAVVYIDLDGFKSVNDTHGHTCGDQLLIAIATRMKQAVRDSDTVARLGGDEFVAVLNDLPHAEYSFPMLSRLLEASAQPVTVEERILQVSASVGVTFFPQAEEVDADQLLRQADQAMYQAKLAGKNRYILFDADQHRNEKGRHESLGSIQRALHNNEFVLHYQPIVNLRSGQVVAAEALIRWQHPEKGLLPPAAFLPLIEDNPLAVEVGDWVIETALRQLRQWRAEGIDISVSVNIGSQQLQQEDFVGRLKEKLAGFTDIPASRLKLEVLETSALNDIDEVSRIINDCKELGIPFALDDFGTGYSSLLYLKRLPAAQIKIDQGFVRDMLDDPDDLAILEGVIGLADAFRREAIAEGVESEVHAEMLLQLGCTLAQGYGIARPMPGSAIPGWMRSWKPPPEWETCEPLHREELPLLIAGVEHRAWVNALQAYLKDESVTLPPLDPRQCRLGQWLYSHGKEHYGQCSEYPRIEHIHNTIHALAEELIALKAAGQPDGLTDGWPKVCAMRDELLEHLRKLLAAKPFAR